MCFEEGKVQKPYSWIFPINFLSECTPSVCTPNIWTLVLKLLGNVHVSIQNASVHKKLMGVTSMKGGKV